jgi:hypothetical protein
MWKQIFAMLAALVLCSQSAASQSTATPGPAEILPITFDPAGMSDSGGDRLRSELDGAQFIALGEDHGFADAPVLARALAAEMKSIGGPVFHAAEIGPFTAKWLQQQFEGKRPDNGLRSVADALKGKGLAMPFTSNVEDSMLAADFFDKGGKSRLWGIDQEFMGAPMILLDGLAARARDPALRKMLAEISKADRKALAKLDFGNAWLGKVRRDDIEVIANGFRDDRDALSLIEALADSAEIYQLNNQSAYQASNEYRSALMQGYFLDKYRKAGPAPRVLLKMGAYHLGRGTTPTGIYDLGSLLPGLAAANGKRSLHIAYVPISGSVRTFGPSETGVSTVKAYKDEGVAALLAAANVAPETIPAAGHVLIPLTAIRHRMTGEQKRELTELARFVLNGFDYLVTTRDAKAATHFEAWAPGTD